MCLSLEFCSLVASKQPLLAVNVNVELPVWRGKHMPLLLLRSLVDDADDDDDDLIKNTK